MWILTILYTLLMLKQCICGPTKKLAEGVKTEKKEGPQTPQQPAPDTSTKIEKDSIDLEDVTDPRYSVLGVDISGVPARVYVVNPKESIKKVVYDNKKLCEAMRKIPKGDVTQESDEKCTYCIVFLKNGDPKAILVKIDNFSRSYKKLFTYEEKTGCGGRGGPGWSRSITEYTQEIAALKTCTGPPTKFSLDISSSEDTDNYKVTRSEQDGVTTLFFATKSCHTIENVMDGETKICALNDDFTCYLCEVHSKGNSKLIRIHAEKGYAIIFGWYEKYSGTWTAIKEKEFFKKLDEISEVTAIT